MNTGIIYLVQPVELIGTSRYKVGYSGKNTLERVKSGYKTGTRYIFIMETNEPLILEKNIKTLFNKKFKLIGGSEYFEGDEEIMKEAFLKLKIEHDKKYSKIETNKDCDDTNDDNTHDDETNEEIDTCDDLIKKPNNYEKPNKIKNIEDYKKNNKTCPDCGKKFNQKNDYRRHINRKKSCVKKEKLHQKHMEETINVLHKKIEQLENMNKELQFTQRIKQLEKKNKELQESLEKALNITTNIVDFGKEDYSFIDEKTTRKILNCGCKALNELISMVHFNKDKPEYHNIFISNWRDKSYVSFFRNNKWQLGSKEQVLNELKDKGIDFLQSKFEELEELDEDDPKNEFIISKMRRFLHKYNKGNEIPDLDNDLMLILYNNRDMIKNK